MKVGSRPVPPLPVAARVGAGPIHASGRSAPPAAPGRGSPATADRVEISAEAVRAAAAESLGTAEGRSGAQVRDLVGRANREAARAVQRPGGSSLAALRQFLG